MQQSGICQAHLTNPCISGFRHAVSATLLSLKVKCREQCNFVVFYIESNFGFPYLLKYSLPLEVVASGRHLAHKYACRNQLYIANKPVKECMRILAVKMACQ